MSKFIWLLITTVFITYPMSYYRNIIEQLIKPTGIKIGGTNPWDVQVYDDRFYKRVISKGSVGLGESYMEGWWESPSPDQLFYKLFTSDIDKKVKRNFSLLWGLLIARLFNQQ